MLRGLVVALALTCACASLQGDWAVFKHQYGKKYEKRDEEARRMAIFQENLKVIDEHNDRYAKGQVSFYLGVNQFADMTTAEWSSMVNGLMPRERPIGRPVRSPQVNVSDLPSTVDWREKGYVTEVKDQGQCGSCWAFSATGTLEGQHFKATGDLIGLSESQLVDCSFDWGNHGCNGGLMSNAFDYIIDVKGIESEESYPYVPKENDCAFDTKKVVATMKSYTSVKDNEPALQEAVAQVGPIAVAIDASRSSFQLYKSGVYDDPKCGNQVWELNHAVLAVGYGSDNGDDYWIVKNSWGKTWGDEGYILMSRNKDNQCGIALIADYPNV